MGHGSRAGGGCLEGDSSVVGISSVTEEMSSRVMVFITGVI